MTKNIVYFDLETQYLFRELGMLNWKSQDPTKLKIAIAGTLTNNNHLFFLEDQISDLVKNLKKADLIIGHNLLRFDYLVILPYVGEDVIQSLSKKTFDTFTDLRELTGIMIGLDDLCKRNLGISKTEDPLKIPKMWRDGKHKEVMEYLLNDLKMTEALFNHGRKIGKLKYEHKDYGKSLGEREISVKWTS